MRTADDSKTIDMFPPEVRAPRRQVNMTERQEAREAARLLRVQKLRESQEKKRWVVVEQAGTVDEYVWDHCPFSTHAEALRGGSGCGIHFDVMFRLPDGTLTTEF